MGEKATTKEVPAEDRIGLSDWRFARWDWVACLLLVLAGSLLWLPGLGRRGLWTSGEARAVQTARRMVKSGKWVPMTLEKGMPLLMVDPASGERGDTITGWKRWPTKLSYDDPCAVLALEEDWRDTVKAALEKGGPPIELRYDYVPQIHKPVFFYWLVAAGYTLGVPMEGPWMAFSIRCFSTVPAILLLPVVYLFGCLLYDRLAGLIAAVSLATCVEYFWLARVAKMDMTLTFMLGVAFLLWYLGHRGIRPLACNLGVYVLLGCAALMKSLAYFLLPGLIVLIYLAIEGIGEHGWRGGLRQWPAAIWRTMRRMHFLAGVVIVLAIWLPWHVLIHIETDGQFTREMFLRHNLSRAGIMDYGKEFEAKTNALFYFGRLVADMLPWWIMLPGAMIHVFRPRCRAFWRQGAWLMAWMLAWMAFFSYLSFRKEEYILPMYPAAALLIGKMLADLIRAPAGGHISWRTFADATKVGLAWLIGRRAAASDPDSSVEGDLHLTIAVRMAAVAMALAAVVIGIGALLMMSEGVRDFMFAFPDADEPWIGTNEHDRTAFSALAVFMRGHIIATCVYILAVAGAMVIAAAMVFKRRCGVAVALWAGTMAVALLPMVHVFQDRTLDPLRSQRALASRLGEVIAETGEDTRLILFGAEDHELVTLMPDRFDAIPRLRFAMLRGRLLALKDHPVIVLLPRKDYEDGSLFGEFAWDDLLKTIEEVPTGMPRYDRAHNDALVILRSPRGRAPVTQPMRPGQGT
ncbi:MAG: glycosyltransferase family 39 protein [Phycisphaerae bacterium]|nr:glycosyltransferase family 39 protein [Phycisphaerae bacterium]